MKIKTSELIGPALDWAVAKAEGYLEDCNSWLYEACLEEVAEGSYHPSTNPSQAWPIIEQEGISIRREDEGWYATVGAKGEMAFTCLPTADGGGPTSLIAAMRCWVAFKLGDEVEIPEELA